MAEKLISLEEVVTLAKSLSARDKLHLLERVLPGLEHSLFGKPSVARRRSLVGLCADLGCAPSSDDIDKARKEMWGDFQKENP